MSFQGPMDHSKGIRQTQWENMGKLDPERSPKVSGIGKKDFGPTGFEKSEKYPLVMSK